MLQASLRGRPLYGQPQSLPAGYVGKHMCAMRLWLATSGVVRRVPHCSGCNADTIKDYWSCGTAVRLVVLAGPSKRLLLPLFRLSPVLRSCACCAVQIADVVVFSPPLGREPPAESAFPRLALALAGYVMRTSTTASGDKTMAICGTLKEITAWCLDSLPSQDNSFRKCMDWVDIASVVCLCSFLLLLAHCGLHRTWSFDFVLMSP